MRPKGGNRERLKRSQSEAAEISLLESRIAEGAPPKHGSIEINPQESSYLQARKFSELPLSEYTKEGLKAAGFKQLTAIQRFALPQALCGRDVFGAAKTGSGKTLAFLIPIVEKLYRLKWSQYDGLGALVISPTRELALQIFNELRKIGKEHEFSAGLMIGGKNVKEEQERVGSINILICTPGRLLQHMDETPEFDASNIQILVLDEADRILDLGFSSAVDAIIQNLPLTRQTLLFSATQKQSVKQLARLSLQKPQYVSVHENAEAPTPAKLEQATATCELYDKLNVVWSFIRSHLKAKTLVFTSTCKQVKFLFEAFSRLRPGCPLRCLHGGMKQMKRMAVFYDFSESTSGMVLFATDIAARGLDFAKLDWVLQMDCPEDVPAYIHRVGRTARYVSAGRGLLLLTPSEQPFLDQLKEAKVPIKSIKINPNKTQPITAALQALLSKNQALKESAQRSMTAYLRSVFLAPNKAVFDVKVLPAEEYALSMGLSAPPKLRFIRRGGESSKQALAKPRLTQQEKPIPPPEEVEEEKEVADAGGSSGPAAEDDDLLQVKSAEPPDEPADKAAADGGTADAPPPSKRRKRMKIHAGKASGSRIVFDDEGAGVDPLAAMAEAGESWGEDGGSIDLPKDAAERFKNAAAVLRARDIEDRKDYKERRRKQAADAKAKRKATEAGEAEGSAVILGPGLGFPSAQGISSNNDESGDEDITVARPGRRHRKQDGWKSDSTAGPEASHMGMATKNAQLSIADQEQLALDLLARKRAL